jgi:hypothetical protein
MKKEYKFAVEHNMDGNGDYLKELFNDEKPHLQKTLNRLRLEGITPRVGDMIYGEDNCFYIKQICFYNSGCVFWVDEEKNREDEDE